MDPVSTTLVSAFVAGAVAGGAKKLGESAVADAYAGLKQVVLETYAKAGDLIQSIAGLEQRPDSDGRRQTVAEELTRAGALDDQALVEAAEAVIAAVEKSGAARTIGIDWEDVSAARLKIGAIRAQAGAIGFRAARMRITGDVEIAGIDVGGVQGK